MFKFQGMWLPDGEAHFPEWMARNGELVGGRGTYQIRKFREAMKYVRGFRTAVDVGAHVGFWSVQMHTRFATLHAFEPMAVFRECFTRNLAPFDPARALVLHDVALGAAPGRAYMHYTPADSGNTHVVSKGEGEGVELRTLDSYRLQDVDFIKIDCEGYELAVLQGAVETLERWHPTIIVEQKQHKLAANYGTRGVPAVDFLRERGWKMVKEIGGDFIMVHQ